MDTEDEFTRVKTPPKNAKLGDHYIVENGCPDCGADLCVISGVAVWCSTHGEWGFDNNGCGYRFMSG